MFREIYWNPQPVQLSLRFCDRLLRLGDVIGVRCLLTGDIDVDAIAVLVEPVYISRQHGQHQEHHKADDDVEPERRNVTRAPTRYEFRSQEAGPENERHQGAPESGIPGKQISKDIAGGFSKLEITAAFTLSAVVAILAAQGSAAVSTICQVSLDAGLFHALPP